MPVNVCVFANMAASAALVFLGCLCHLQAVMSTVLMLTQFIIVALLIFLMVRTNIFLTFDLVLTQLMF